MYTFILTHKTKLKTKKHGKSAQNMQFGAWCLKVVLVHTTYTWCKYAIDQAEVDSSNVLT